ncbi:MAG: hypothetical protein ACFFCW_25920 [Candidatus Hodarchaeota archaeon]
MVQVKPLKVVIISILFACWFGFFSQALALPVFPGAVGYGTDTSAGFYRPGGKTPVIYIVTSTAHASGKPTLSERNGVSVYTGTLIQCIEHDPGTNVPKIILFEVSGTITADSPPYTYYIDHPYTTIAGQTAPSPGITLKNIRLRVRKGHDTLIQHIRSRIGDIKAGEDPDVRRAITVGYVTGENPYNVVIDHVSASWATDINIGIGESNNVTVSNSIISECLNDSLHSKGAHSKGFSSSGGATKTFFYRNLSAHNIDRNPLLQGGSKLLINNVIYNPGDFNIFVQNKNDEPTNASIVNNLIKGGPNSDWTAEQLSPRLTPGLNTSSRLFIDGNRTMWGNNDYYEQSNSSDWSHVRNQTGYSDDKYKITKPEIWINNVPIEKTSELFDIIIKNVGARPLDRDAVDKRIINDFIKGTGKIINSPSEVGGWPNLAVNKSKLNIPQNPNGDDDKDGYTNIEEWIQGYSVKVAGSGTAGDGTILAAPVLSVAGSNP